MVFLMQFFLTVFSLHPIRMDRLKLHLFMFVVVIAVSCGAYGENIMVNATIQEITYHFGKKATLL